MIHLPVVEDWTILAVVARCVRSGTESVANPLDGLVSIRPGIHTDDIESCRVGSESPSACEKHFGGPRELVLLAPVDGQGGTRERSGGAITDLDEHQAIVIQHYEVDFANAAAVIALNGLQAFVLQVSTRKLLDRVS